MVPCDRAAQCEMNDGSYADRQGMISPSVPVEHIRHMALSVAGQLGTQLASKVSELSSYAYVAEFARR